MNRGYAAQQRMPAEPPHPCGGRLRIHFQLPVCHNGLWLFDVFRFVHGGDGCFFPLAERSGVQGRIEISSAV